MPDQPKRAFQYKGGWPGVVWPPVVRGRCTVHDARVPPGSVCIECHHEQLAAAGVDLSTIAAAMQRPPPAPYSQPYDPARHGAPEFLMTSEENPRGDEP